MKIKLLVFCSLAILTYKVSVSQNSFESLLVYGKVIDHENNQPLMYVNIGILNKASGTLTDTSGKFTFQISKNNLNDTIQISMIGYVTKKITVREYLSSVDKTMMLFEKNTVLEEVKVERSMRKFKIIGRQRSGKFIQMSVHNKKTTDQTIGSEIGMRYKNYNLNAFFKDFNFYLSVNNFNSIKFRLNIYSVKGDMPDTIIYNKQIFTTVEGFKTGWIKVNLESCNIRVPQDFIITSQWMESKMEKKENPLTVLPIVLEPFTKNCFMRIASQDKWIRKGIGLSNFVTVAY